MTIMDALDDMIKHGKKRTISENESIRNQMEIDIAGIIADEANISDEAKCFEIADKIMDEVVIKYLGDTV